MATILIERGADVKTAVAADPKCRSEVEEIERMIAEAHAAARAKAERLAREQVEIARQARLRAEATAIWNTLEVSQSLEFFTGSHTETKSPGEDIYLGVLVKNKGAAPVSGIKCVLEPNKYIEVPGSDTVIRRTFQHKLRQWETTGLPLIRIREKQYPADVVNPRDDPHYEEQTKSIELSTHMVPFSRAEKAACEKAEKAAGVMFSWAGFAFDTGWESLPLVLSKNAPAGSDIAVQFYLVIKGQKFPLPPMTIQVMRKE